MSSASCSVPPGLRTATYWLRQEQIPTYQAEVALFFGIRADGAIAVPPAQVKFRYSIERPPEPAAISGTDEEMVVAETMCSNCCRPVPPSNMAMHEDFCQRNNFRCPVAGCGQVMLQKQRADHCHCDHCGWVFLAAELPVHVESFHSEHVCSMCSDWTGTLLPLRAHQRGGCTERVIQCRFCENLVPSGGDPDDWRDRFHWGLTQHESICGSKTTACEQCGQSVRVKELAFHIQVHARIVAERAKATHLQQAHPPANVLPQQPSELHREPDPEDWNCPICSATLTSLRLLNSHLDTQH